MDYWHFIGELAADLSLLLCDVMGESRDDVTLMLCIEGGVKSTLDKRAGERAHGGDSRKFAGKCVFLPGATTLI